MASKVDMMKSEKRINKYDIIIVGAGTAGHVAALQAARCGMNVLLAEKNDISGGTITLGGISFPGLFYAWGKQIISGIGWEMVTKAVNVTGGRLPDFQDLSLPHYKHQVELSAPIYAAVIEDEMLKAGVNIAYHCMPYEIGNDGALWNVEIATKTGAKVVHSKILIDCTGDANMVKMAGYGVKENDVKQPGTQNMQVSGFDLDKLDYGYINLEYKRAIFLNSLLDGDLGFHGDRCAEYFLKDSGDNSNHITNINATTSEGKTQADFNSRQAVLRIYDFFKRLEGLENFQIDLIYSECGIREIVTICGDQTVTVDDYLSGRVWHDSICYSYYPIDLHINSGEEFSIKKLKEGVVPTIPLGSMIPKGSRNLLAAGRCIDSDQLANSALRTQATCMATGQTAGAIASIAVQQGVDISKVEIQSIKDLLRDNGAICP